MISFIIEHKKFKNEPIKTSHCAHEFFIGSSLQSHIKVITKENGTYLKVVQNQDGIIIESLGNYSYLHNGVKYQGSKKCIQGDVIQIDNSTLKIASFDPEGIVYPINYSKIIIQQEDQSLMNALEKEILYAHKSLE